MKVRGPYEVDPILRDGVLWRHGKPEVVISFVVQPGQMMSFKLRLRENGAVKKTIDLGAVDAEAGSAPQKVFVKVGTFLKSGGPLGSIHALAAVRTGKNGHSSKTVTDLRGWVFETDLPGDMTYGGPATDTIQLATPGGDASAEGNAELVLEISVTNPGNEP